MTSVDALSQLLNARLLLVGRTVVTPVSLASAAVVMGLAFGAARLASLVLARMRRHARSGRTPLYIVQKLTTYSLVAFGVFTGLSTVGIDLSSLAVFAGAIGVGVGLGLQGVVKEFVSGLVLIFDNELHVGDFIELDSSKVRGEVMEIGARATHIRTNDNVDVLVPNSKLIDGTIINWTQGGDTRRIHIPFTVAYGVDKARVRDAVLKAAREVSFTLPDDGERKTQVWMTGFGDSALNFELVVWPALAAAKRPASMQAAYTWAIEDALRRADIEMPFPQTDLRIRSVFGQEGEAAMRTLGLAQADEASGQDGEGERTGPHRRTHNDAAEDTVAPARAPSVRPAPAEAAPADKAGTARPDHI